MMEDSGQSIDPDYPTGLLEDDQHKSETYLNESRKVGQQTNDNYGDNLSNERMEDVKPLVHRGIVQDPDYPVELLDHPDPENDEDDSNQDDDGNNHHSISMSDLDVLGQHSAINTKSVSHRGMSVQNVQGTEGESLKPSTKKSFLDAFQESSINLFTFKGAPESASSIDPGILNKLDEKARKKRMVEGFLFCFMAFTAMLVMVSLLIFTEQKSQLHYPKDYKTNKETRAITNLLKTISDEHQIFRVGTPQYAALHWMLYDDKLKEQQIAKVKELGTGYIMLARYALAVFFFSTGGEQWKNRDGWLTSTSVCDWIGLSCVHDEVFSIELRDNNLVGTIPQEIDSVHILRQLILPDNYLRGTLPDNIHSINLKDIDLSNNDIEGTLPDLFFNNFNDIETINFNNNNMKGSIPETRGFDRNLVKLELAGNGFTGTLSRDLFEDKSGLEILNLKANKIKGKIPLNIGSMKNLLKLDLGDNMFSGTIPSSVNYLARIEQFNIHQNMISGSIPESFGAHHRNLTNLNLNDNLLTGTLSYNLHFMHKLVVLDLSFNQLKGTISNEFLFFQQMQLLALNENTFSGTIPFEGVLDELSKLDMISFHSNRMTGTIQSAVGRLSKLRTLSLGDNLLTGEIPREIADMTSLVSLGLEDTQLSGTVHESICVLKSVKLDTFAVDCDEVSCTCCTNCS